MSKGTISIGIDIGKRKCDVCVMDGKGKVLHTGQYQNTVSDADKFAEQTALRYSARRCQAACETTGNMWNITYGAFERHGIDIKLANTYKMAIIAKTGKKTDKIDAQKIASVLRMDSIPECYVPSADTRGVRAMVRQRIRTVQDRTRVINRVHSLLDRYDVKIDASEMYAIKAVEQMESASLGSVHDEIVLSQCARQIKEYLGKIAFDEKPHLVKNSMYAIRSFFRENESEIIFYFKSRIRLTKNIPTAPLSIETLQKILTIRNIQPIEKAVFLCKFQRGLDSSTFADRFNFEVWEQLVEHFQSDKPELWDVKNTSVPIQLRRTKTDFLHMGFLDTDAVVALVEYLHVRHAKPKVGEALFVNRAKKPITVNWLSRRFHKLVARVELLRGDHTMNRCTPHEMRDLLKSTLIDSGCRPDVADHVLGHSPKDSYEKQALLYPESLTYEFSKASERINILSRYNKKQHGRSVQDLLPSKDFGELYHRIIMHEKRILQFEQDNCKTDSRNQSRRIVQDYMHEKTSLTLNRKLFIMYTVMYSMQSLESFVDQAIKEGRDDIKDFDEFKKILDILDVKEKPIYLKYEVHSNT